MKLSQLLMFCDEVNKENLDISILDAFRNVMKRKTSSELLIIRASLQGLATLINDEVQSR